jgi:hypothetical protein
MKTVDDSLILAALEAIDSLLGRGVLPVDSGHLKHLFSENETIEHLLFLKSEGLISGDLVTKGASNRPYRMTNIRLTYQGIRLLRS